MDETERLTLPLATGALALPEGPVAFLNAKMGAGLAALPRAQLRCAQGFRPEHDALAMAGFEVAPEIGGGFAAALVLAARNRIETLGLVARAARMTAPGGPVVVSGAKTDGIEAALARLRAVAAPAGVISKAHGKTFWFLRPDPMPADFAGWEGEAAPRPNAEGFLAAPGMFSHAHADPGSMRLAGALAGALSGRVAELGAGYGWLGSRLLAANPAIAALTLVEADHAALQAARANVTDPRAIFLWADAARLGKEAGPFDHVVSNPPVHVGRALEPRLGIAFIEAARRLLAPSGRLHLVANRQLPYEAALARLFTESGETGAGGGYKLLWAARPRKGLVRPRR